MKSMSLVGSPEVMSLRHMVDVGGVAVLATAGEPSDGSGDTSHRPAGGSQGTRQQEASSGRDVRTVGAIPRRRWLAGIPNTTVFSLGEMRDEM